MTQIKKNIVAVVGMCGAGKSEVAEQFVNAGYAYVRLGQITIDEIKNRGLEISEINERKIREELRAQHGMAAFAKLNTPKFEANFAMGKDVLADGLYSWSEYKMLKEKYGQHLIVVCVYAPPAVRYGRLENRHRQHTDDAEVKFRSLSREQAAERDYKEIENIEKGGPIAIADYTIVNTGTLDQLHQEAQKIIEQIISL